MTVIGVPYHLDEHVPDLDVPLEPDAVVTAGLPAGDPWERMTVLQSAVADAVAEDVASGVRPVVLSGDCNTSAGVMAGLQRAGVDPAIVWFDAHGDVRGRTARPALPGARRTGRRPARGRAANAAGHRPGGRARPRLQLAPGPRGGPARRGRAGRRPGVTARTRSAARELPPAAGPLPWSNHRRATPRTCAPGAARRRRAVRWPPGRTAPDPAAAPRPGRTPRPLR